MLERASLKSSFCIDAFYVYFYANFTKIIGNFVSIDDKFNLSNE